MFYLNPRLSADVFDGEYIIANLDSGLYYSIQGLAVSLIQALPAQDHHALIERFAGAFPDMAGQVRQELHSVFQELLKEEIISEGAAALSGTDYVLPDRYVPSAFNRYADMQDLLLLDPIHDVNEEGWAVQKES